MKNKRLIICLSIFATLVILIVLTSTIFALQQVSVLFAETPNKLAGMESQIVESASFNYGQNVLFLNKSSYVEKIEKQFPYIKVLNIETIFPNKLVINAVERQETFAIKLSNNNYAIVDEQFKVLDISTTYINSSSNAIELLNLSNISQSVEKADILSFTDTQKQLLSLTFDSLLEWTNNIPQLQSKIQSITVDYERTDQLALKMYSGVTIVVKDASEYNSDKFNLAFSAYEADEKYRQSGILEVRLVTNAQTQNKELRVFYQSA